MRHKNVRCGRCRKYLSFGPSPTDFAPAPAFLQCDGCGVDNAADGLAYRFGYYFQYTLRLWVLLTLLFMLSRMIQIGSFDPVALGRATLAFGFVVGVVASATLALPVGTLVEWIDEWTTRRRAPGPPAVVHRASAARELPLSALLGRTLERDLLLPAERPRRRSA